MSWMQRFLGRLAICFGLVVPCAVSGSAQERFAQDERSRDAGASTGLSWPGSNWLGGNDLNRNQWRLGIEGNDTETGVVIRSVAPRSAAANARLEPRDTIVAVEGYQVGNVGGRLYSLPDELNRRAKANGLVNLLVQDNRSGRLATVRVQLDPERSGLTGVLDYTGRTPLPSDAVVTVQIENVSRPLYAVRNGQTSFRPTALNSIPFRVDYDASYVDAQDVYRVRAYVTSGGRTILETPVPQNVITRGNPTDVRLTLAPLGQNALVSAGGSSVITAGYPNFNTIDQQITNIYQQLLGRNPSMLELAALHSRPGTQDPSQRVRLELLAGQEYFDLVGNNNLAWLDRVFQLMVGKRPTQLELEQWMRRYAELGYSRTQLLTQLDSQVRR